MNDTEMVFNRWSQFLCEKLTLNLIMSGLYLDHTWLLSSLGCSSRSPWCGHRWSCSGSHRSGGIHTHMCPGDTLHGTKASKISLKMLELQVCSTTGVQPHVPVRGQQVAMCHQHQISPGNAFKRNPQCAGERKIVFRCVFVLHLQCH